MTTTAGRALATLAVAALMGVQPLTAMAQEGSFHRSTAIVDTSEIPAVGPFLPEGPAWEIDDGIGDHMATNGIPVPGLTGVHDVQKAWTAFLELDRQARRGVRRYLQQDETRAWGPARLPTGVPMLVSVFDLAGDLTCEEASDYHLWVSWDGDDGPPATVERTADPTQGSQLVTASGRFGGSFETRTTDQGDDDASLPVEYYDGEPRDSGRCDQGVGVIVNFSPVPEGASTVGQTLAVQTERGFFWDPFGIPDDLSRTPVGETPSQPGFACLTWVALAPLIPVEGAPDVSDGEDDRSAPAGRLQQRMVTRALDWLEQWTMDSARPPASEASPSPEYLAFLRETYSQDLGDVSVERHAIGGGLDVVVATQDIDAGSYDLSILPSPDSVVSASARPLSIFVQRGDQGTLYGDGRCGAWHLDGTACDYVDGDGYITALGIEFEQVVEEAFSGFDGAQVCNVHVDGAPEPTVVVDIQEDLFPADAHRSEPPPSGCVHTVLDGDVITPEEGDVVLMCDRGAHTRIVSQASPSGIVSASDEDTPAPELRMTHVLTDLPVDVRLDLFLMETIETAQRISDSAELYIGASPGDGA